MLQYIVTTFINFNNFYFIEVVIGELMRNVVAFTIKIGLSERIFLKTSFKDLFIYLFLDRGEGREKGMEGERKGDISVWLPHTYP